jgi:glycosyltransferase involved in cell wall biosynthesis
LKSKREDNVVIVFEPACDAHWMKDVVQFPNALAKELFGRKAVLITRPNDKQLELKKHIDVVFMDEPLPANIEVFNTFDFSKIETRREWYLAACVKATDLGSVLILYPWFGDFTKGAQAFKFHKWKQFKKATVVVKSDGLFQFSSANKATVWQRIKDLRRFYFIDKFIIENKQIFGDMRLNKPQFNSKLVYLPNCPLDMYHEVSPTSYEKRKNQILFVGRVDDTEKGADILFDAWIKIAASIPDWTLHIIGTCSGNIKQEWNTKFSAANVASTIQWVTHQNPSELIARFVGAKIVVCPSRKESGPIILSESILCGCSFIGAAVGEIPEILKELPGLVQNEDTLEKQMLLFARHPEIAFKQAEALFERIKDRKWKVQLKRVAWLKTL